MPQMGESVTEGTILEWHVAEGEEVAEGDTVVEVSTDKIDAEVPAPASGVITKILAQPDDTVEVGQVLAQIDPNGAASRQRRRPVAAEGEPTAWYGRRRGRRGPRRRLGRGRLPTARARSRRLGRPADPRLTRPPPDAKRRRRAERWSLSDARDGRVGDRGHGARVARRGGPAGRRGRHRGRGLDRQDRRRGARRRRRARSRSSGRSPTTPSRSARRWRR